MIFLWAKGYRVDRTTNKIERVGMIMVKSSPDGARVFLDGVFSSATNATIGALKSGNHILRIEKEGYAAWEKTLLVKEEFVTSVSVVLVPLSVEIKPLTSSGVLLPTVTNSGNLIYFISKSTSSDFPQKSGIWQLDLTGSIFNIFRGGASLALPDKKTFIYSAAKTIEISPSDNSLLLKTTNDDYFSVDLTAPNEQPTATNSASALYSSWKEEVTSKKKVLADRYKLKEELYLLSLDPTTVWSPDEKKFLYKKLTSKGDSVEYHVRNLTDPLGVGEKEDYLILTTAKDSITRVIWYPDSNNLVTSECEKYSESKDVSGLKQSCLSGSIHLVNIDGTNNTQIYSGALASSEVFPTPDGSKIIILTTFNQTSSPNLYAIVLH